MRAWVNDAVPMICRWEESRFVSNTYGQIKTV